MNAVEKTTKDRVDSNGRVTMSRSEILQHWTDELIQEFAAYAWMD